MKEIIVLIDYRGFFYSSALNRLFSMDLGKIRDNFYKCGYTTSIRGFSEINFRHDNLRGKIILYQSSEDTDLHYKSYIEDVLLGLHLSGAILIPRFSYFRAHHNKVFMEILRDLSTNDSIRNMESRSFGTYEEFERTNQIIGLPAVLKASSGARSLNVSVHDNYISLKQAIWTVSLSASWYHGLKRRMANKVCKILGIDRGLKMSRNRKKFILQQFVPNLSHDFKILIYGTKYYVMKRRVRPNDFRASGSGLWAWPRDIPPEMLNYAEAVIAGFDVPFISLDVAFDDKQLYLFEFQFLMFGNIAMENSSHYFVKRENRWTLVEEKSSLEREFVTSIVEYINRHYPE